MKNILVPVDFSDITEKIIEKAAIFAKAFNSKLLIIHVAPSVTESIKDKVEFQTLPALGELGSGYTTNIRYDVVRGQIASELHREHSELLKLKNRLTEEEGIKARALLIEGEVVSTILKEAQEFEADCIIMGSHGHGPWHKALLGSVADGVLKNITCPLIIIPSKKKK